MNMKNIILIVVSLFVGIIMGRVQSVEVKEDTTLTTTWKSIKDLDDKVFVLAGEQMQLCTKGLNAFKNADVSGMYKVATDIKGKTEEVNKLAEQRQELLRQVGY